MARKRQNGEGTIFKNTEGYWVAKIAIGKTETGRVSYKVFKNKKQKVVLEKLKEYQIKTSQGLIIADNIYLEEYISMWLNSVKINDLKITSYDRAACTIYTHIIPCLGHYKLSHLTTELIQQELINKIVREKSKTTGKHLSYSSIYKIFVYLNSCLKYAVSNRKLPYNPCDNVVLPSKEKFEKKDIRFFNDEEIERFKDAARSVTSAKQTPIFKYGEAYILDLYTGMRVGELIGLKWKHVDLENNRILVKETLVSVYDYEEKKKVMAQQNTTKNNRERWITLTQSAKEIILKLKENHKDDNDFVVTNNQKMLVTNNFIKGYKRICERANITNEHGIHTLRHTFASLLFRKGVDAKAVSALLGHADVAFTYNTYIHLIEEQKIKAIELLDNI